MSGIYKGISGMSLFLSIGVLVDYLSHEGFGIWVLLFTVFQLVLLMDFGIQSSLKTKIPLYAHEDDKIKVQQLINTTYKISLFIGFSLFIIFLCVSLLLDFKSIFNITVIDSQEIFILISVNIFFFCLTFVANIHKSLYVAFLKGKFAEQSIAINQVLFLISLLLFVDFGNKFSSEFDKIMFISILNGLLSLIVNLVYTLLLFKKESLTLNLFDTFKKDKLKELLNLGLKFMILQIGFLFIFSADNYIISNAFNPTEIVSYELVNKLFQFPFLILFAALSPLWSMFAKNYIEQNKNQLKKSFRNFNYFMILIGLGLLFLYLLTPFLLEIWIKEEVILPQGLVLLMALITMLKIYTSFYSFFLNGIGKLNLYLGLLLLGALIKLPLSYLMIGYGFGINSVLISSLIIVILWTVFLPMACARFINVIPEK